MNTTQAQNSKTSKVSFSVRHIVGASLLALGIGCLLALGGCAGQSAPMDADMGASTSTETSGAASAPESDLKETGATGNSGPGSGAGAPKNPTAQLIQSASTIPHKIIYNATVDLVAENFSAAQRNLLSLIQKHQGYLAETSVGGTPGSPRQGTWKIRIPEGQFSAFMAAVVKLGELQTTHTDSQDVTAEFYDLQARIANKQVEERRLLDHLQRSTAKLSDILQIEREISRVRGEIEQMQGRLRLLANMTALTTITVTLREVKGYVAPQPTTFSSQIARSFQASITALLDLGKGLVIIAVAVLPWLVLFALIGIPAWRLARRLYPKA